MFDLRRLTTADARLSGSDTLAVRVARAGCHRVEDIYQGVRMAHPDIGFYLVDAPGMRAEADGHVWPYVPGRITVIPPWWYYTYRFTPAMGHAYLHVQVPGWPSALLRRHLRHPIVLDDAGLVASYRAWCGDLRGGTHDTEVRLAALQLAIGCIRALAATVPGIATDLLHRDQGAWRVLRPAMELIDERLAGPLAVADIAATLGCSREHCARLFQRHLGQSPITYLQERRVARAIELIRGGSTVAEAARAVGAGTRQYLGRLVRRHLGRPPSALVRPSGR